MAPANNPVAINGTSQFKLPLRMAHNDHVAACNAAVSPIVVFLEAMTTFHLIQKSTLLALVLGAATWAHAEGAHPQGVQGQTRRCPLGRA